jgi:hypothetical protein
MTKKNESGKARFIKGSLTYLWEEIKTMNMVKIQALYLVLTGYIKMKMRKHQKAEPKRLEYTFEN